MVWKNLHRLLKSQNTKMKKMNKSMKMRTSMQIKSKLMFKMKKTTTMCNEFSAHNKKVKHWLKSTKTAPTPHLPRVFIKKRSFMLNSKKRNMKLNSRMKGQKLSSDNKWKSNRWILVTQKNSRNTVTNLIIPRRPEPEENGCTALSIRPRVKS